MRGWIFHHNLVYCLVGRWECAVYIADGRLDWVCAPGSIPIGVDMYGNLITRLRFLECLMSCTAYIGCVFTEIFWCSFVTRAFIAIVSGKVSRSLPVAPLHLSRLLVIMGHWHHIQMFCALHAVLLARGSQYGMFGVAWRRRRRAALKNILLLHCLVSSDGLGLGPINMFTG